MDMNERNGFSRRGLLGSIAIAAALLLAVVVLSCGREYETGAVPPCPTCPPGAYDTTGQYIVPPVGRFERVQVDGSSNNPTLYVDQEGGGYIVRLDDGGTFAFGVTDGGDVVLMNGEVISNSTDGLVVINTDRIAIGSNQVASEYWATVSGGITNTASAGGSTVGGGAVNVASGLGSTIGGGAMNVANNQHATIGGGYSNSAGSRGTVAGGYDNTVSGASATVGGGYTNVASGQYAVVSGGQSNTASGADSTVPGGLSNTASGDYCFAAGRRAICDDSGAFVWADGTNVNYNSAGVNSFNVRAGGGVTITIGAHSYVFSPAATPGFYIDGVGPLTFTAPITISGVLTNVLLLYSQVGGGGPQ
jgi:hypothetical protein